MSLNKLTRLLLSMAVATMLIGFSASAYQDKPKTEAKKEMNDDKASTKKGHSHKAMKMKMDKEKKKEKKEEAQPK